MSQKAVLVRINGNLVHEVFSHVLDYEDMVQICIDEGCETDNCASDYFLVEYEWIDIGEGESGTDEYLDDETLLFIYDADGWEDIIYKQTGQYVDVVQSGSVEVLCKDIAREMEE